MKRTLGFCGEPENSWIEPRKRVNRRRIGLRIVMKIRETN
jgi:hypothetical protein